ncbi:dihydrodipicolinate synthase family protein [Saccharibacillus sp. CPCC 101409]|uniref:dihydrodipicolinate synthase family protein n=1 Tax=Saccharibacillus sp. CPCC 101409 TaxID=3058041 RepID=UPI0026739D0D|nr:dihydrodipicolinate synthase family protein [Saccharibacillus sp. CPCC 101409]MDO3412379.1 dihydrodipicolinate synthase family protein [Saccharibacillus sp. CPCC 101409]
MFTGLSAFPLTPLNEEGIVEDAFVGLIDRLSAARVDSIGVLGSTGSYMYLDRGERRRAIELAVGHADGLPVMAGIGALRTRDVLSLAEDAQRAGASAVLLAPVSYQPLTDDEVFSLYEQVSRALSVPLCVYDNPRTTKFTFSDELHGRIARLPRVSSIKIPGVPADPQAAAARVEALRALLPESVTIGVSGDALGAAGLNAGCEAFYSVLGGLFPEWGMKLVRLARSGQADEALRFSAQLEPIWTQFAEYGSQRVAAAVAVHCGWMPAPGLRLPIKPLPRDAERELAAFLDRRNLLA